MSQVLSDYYSVGTQQARAQFDYTIDATRVICNPRGYPDEPNEKFDPQLVAEI